jgi:branched-chain amino acid transport system ATP-binding protein
MLRVTGLNTYYGTGHILQGVDLEIEKGQIAAVLGRNGVGKTTTVRSIMGLVPPRSGEVWLGDANMAGWAPYRVARAGVAYVPEGRMIFPDLTVIDNLRVAERRPAKIWPMERLLELFPSLADRRAHKGSQLSGGEQQMLAVARALITDPTVMLFDEPSQGLAPLVVRELAGVIRQLRDEGVTVLLVEQNLKLAEAVGDIVYVMVKGRMMYRAPIAQFQLERESVKSKYLAL